MFLFFSPSGIEGRDELVAIVMVVERVQLRVVVVYHTGFPLVSLANVLEAFRQESLVLFVGLFGFEALCARV